MTTLFKYMDYLGVDFFDAPTFRLSRLNELNDPFEAELSSKINSFCKKASKVITDSNGETDAPTKPDDIRDFIRSAMETICIISFSETYRSLLMWAHYAKSHSGICIEVEEDWSISKKYLSDVLASKVHRLTRVKYDNARNEFDSLEFLSVKDWHDIIIEIITSQLSLKSDEWIYEKEHRYIMTLLETDFFKARNNLEVPGLVTDKLRLNVEKEELIQNGNEYFVNGIKSEEAIYTSMECDAFMYLIKIPPEKIKSVYLGHKFSHVERMKVLTRISDPTHPLHHVTFYQHTISPDRFELERRVIHSPKT